MGPNVAAEITAAVPVVAPVTVILIAVPFSAVAGTADL